MLAFIIPSVERVGNFQDILHRQSKYYFSGKVSISSLKMGCFRFENLASHLDRKLQQVAVEIESQVRDWYNYYNKFGKTAIFSIIDREV